MNITDFERGLREKLADTDFNPLLGEMSGPPLQTFRKNIPEFLNKVKGTPKVDYSPFLSLGNAVQQGLGSVFLSKNSIREKVEPKLTEMLMGMHTNTAPTAKIDPIYAPVLQKFFTKNPNVGGLANWALTNTVPSSPN